ncbi:MAG: ABC transporter substrate-binding protein [Geodermatophilaceae bacterium]|nr:ABC transporter substrate-binding protein [Geodermatophilaceae bacterium]
MALPSLTRRGFLGLAAAGVAGSVAACGTDEPATAPSGNPADFEPVTLRNCVYSQNHASAPLLWQQFAPEGITIETAIVTSSAEIQQALEGGSLDFGLIGSYSTILARLEGEFNSKIIGMCARQGIGLIGRTDVVNGIEDLAGRRIAVPPPGVQVLILQALLEDAGLALDGDVEGIPLGYADHPGALERGDVDAYVGTEPLCTQSVVAGIGQRLDAVFDTPVGDFNTAMWASPAMLERPELCRAAALMQKQAAELLTPQGENDPAAWEDLLVTQFGYEQALYEEVLSNIGAEWRFDSTREAQFAGAGELMARLGIVDSEPDYETFFAREYWDI